MRVHERTHAACAQPPRSHGARCAARQHTTSVHGLEVEKNTSELQVERHDGARAEEAEESVVERRGRGGGAGRAEAEEAEERGRVEAEEVEERGRAEAEQRGREEADEAEERRPADSVVRMPNTHGMPTSEGSAA